MNICRRLFVVPLADGNYGKTTIIRSLVSQGVRTDFSVNKKKVRRMITPWGQTIDAYVFGRSYQESEKSKHGSVKKALDNNDADWEKRELIVMPSHVGGTGDIADIEDMIKLAHLAGFDAIAVPIVYCDDQGDNRAALSPALALNWDARWTVSNPWQKDPEGQLLALGNDLWSWISRALAQ
jgi:hypothetical protein